MITRRHFIAGGLGALTGFSALYYLGHTTLLRNALLSGALDIPSDCLHSGLGKAYLKHIKPTPTLKSMQYLLDLRFDGPISCAAGEEGQELREQLQQEFEDGQTTEVEGWVLPETIVLLNAYSTLQGMK